MYKRQALDSVNKLMVSIVMGLVFLIFLIIGMKSFMELKDISKKIDLNNSLEKEIMEYVTVTHKDELMTLASSGEKGDACSGDLYYKRAELITSVITEKSVSYTHLDVYKRQVLHQFLYLYGIAHMQPIH